MYSSSPISKIFLDGRFFYVKRDDIVDPFLAGNKYRKLYYLLQVDPNKYKKIISYGGTQSNAMLAIAALCKEKSWDFHYYTKPLSRHEKTLKFGNFYKSLELGMQHKELDNKLYKEFIASLGVNLDDDTLFLDQGGANLLAKEGLEVLAKEIQRSNLKIKSLATPSGTGTTALFLALALPEYTVYTTPCIGDVKYLKEQISSLHTIPENLIILSPSKKYHFAKPYLEFYEMYEKLLDSGIEFDLLYAPLMWKTLLENVKEEVLYIHSGGISGNESMLQRYKQKGFC